MSKNLFKLNDGSILPVSEKRFLIPFLTNTSKGTNYFDPPPKKQASNIYFASKVLQLHQILDLFKSINVDLKKKSFLDVGTGNGLIPKALIATNSIKFAYGTDLYSPYEHGSANIPLENEKNTKTFFKILSKSIIKSYLNYKSYKNNLRESAEREIFQPQKNYLKRPNYKSSLKYKFKKIGAHDLNLLKKKFDVIYCKGIEHFPDWKKTVKNFKSVSKKNSFVYLRIRPFYSYLGPHRYATTSIPWGHALMNEEEYERYVRKFHFSRKDQMLNSYYNSITYPRYTINELIEIFEKNNFILYGQKIETPPYISKIFKFKKKIKNFEKLISKKVKNLNNNELFSSSQHLIFKRI